MGMGMGMVPWGKRRFFLRDMGRMGQGVGFRVVLFLFFMALLVLAGLGPEVGLLLPGG